MRITKSNFVEVTKDRVLIEADGYEGNLSQYLWSLLTTVLQSKHEVVTFQLLHNLIIHAFRSEPIEFDASWLEVEDTDEELYGENEPWKAMNNEEQFDLGRRTILFHIADYHRMKKAGLLDQDALTLYFGIDSPTGRRWYNFHPIDFTQQGLYGHEDCLFDDPAERGADWITLADIIANGSSYE